MATGSSSAVSAFCPSCKSQPPFVDLLLRHLLREVGQPRVEVLHLQARVALEPVVERAHHRHQRLLVEAGMLEQEGGHAHRLRPVRHRRRRRAALPAGAPAPSAARPRQLTHAGASSAHLALRQLANLRRQEGIVRRVVAQHLAQLGLQILAAPRRRSGAAMASSMSSSTACSEVISPARSRAATCAHRDRCRRPAGAADARHRAGLGRRRLVHTFDRRRLVDGVGRPRGPSPGPLMRIRLATITPSATSARSARARRRWP